MNKGLIVIQVGDTSRKIYSLKSNPEFRTKEGFSDDLRHQSTKKISLVYCKDTPFLNTSWWLPTGLPKGRIRKYLKTY